MSIVELQNVSLAERVIFVLLAAGALGGALFTITRRNPVTAVMSLVATFFALAGIYATLSAHFIAVLQVLVYAGAIMVLFIFVVMILNREEISRVAFRGIVTRTVGLLATAYVMWLGVWVVWRDRGTPVLRGPGPAAAAAPPADFGTVGAVGASLFKDFVFPFEAISLLLLVAIVGGIIVSRSSKQEEMAEATIQRLRAIREQAHDDMVVVGGAGAESGDPEKAHAAAGSSHH